MNGEQFRQDVIVLLTTQVEQGKEIKEGIDKLCEGMVSREDHTRVEQKIEKIWDRVLVMGVVIGGIAAAVGVVGWVS